MDFSELGCFEFTIDDNGSVCHRNSRKLRLIRSAARMTTGQPESRELVWENGNQQKYCEPDEWHY